MVLYVLLLIFVLIQTFFMGLIFYITKKPSNSTESIIRLSQKYAHPPTVINLKPIHQQIDEIPNKVLTSITNSTNTHKGALGELIGYLNIRALYDRIIPLGTIVDFVGIKLPTENTEGSVDFIDIKTGNKARLSKDQKALQQLIKDKKINFCQIKVEASDADHSKKD